MVELLMELHILQEVMAEEPQETSKTLLQQMLSLTQEAVVAEHGQLLLVALAVQA